ncbi:MAG: PepSY domain-containing protein [Sulfuricella sp.]
MKRYLFLTHRWLGIALCLFMAMWFLSGVVMMYVGYPKLSASERLERLPALDSTGCCISLGEAMAATGKDENPKGVRLTSVADVPRFIFTFDKQRVVSVNAQNGKGINDISASEAVEAASVFSKGQKVKYLDLVQEDAWTHSKALDIHRPLHRIEVQDEDATMLYVSSRTGEAIRDATAVERGWNWVGAWIHLLYPFRGGALDKHWHDIVVYTSLLATVLAVSGLVIGVMRWRFTGCYSNSSKSPYRAPFMRWHHLFGLAFGVFAITWIFSGLMSMNPWKVFDSGGKPLNELAYSGGAIEAENFPVDLHGLLKNPQLQDRPAREIEWRIFDGKGYLIAFDGSNRTSIIPVSKDEPPLAMFPLDRLELAGARLIPGARIASSEIPREYDFYYYPRASQAMLGHMDRRLPVMRLKFDDPNSTWVHLDPYTGTVVGKLDTYQRVKRWLFTLLHNWDWMPLLDRRPLWDVLLIVLSLGGFLVSCTGIVIGWHRLKRKQGKPDRKNPPITDTSNA